MEIKESVTFCLVLAYYFTECTPFDMQTNEGNLIGKTSIDTVQFVAVVARHGSRSPRRTFPNDQYPFHNKSLWPNGYLELTSNGKMQMFRIGENLRKKYAGFLPLQYHPGDTVVEYDDSIRDYVSGACILAGLYPPVDSDVWNPDLLWQPIPIYIRKYDLCEIFGDTICPSVKAESDVLLELKEQEFKNNERVAEMMKNITYHTGLNFSGIAEMAYIHDALLMQAENGFTLPSWAADYYPEPMWSAISELTVTALSGSENILRMGVGPELKHISNMLNKKAKRKEKYSRKLYIEAAHDCTLIVLRIALGNKDPHIEIKTSAYLVFELHYISYEYVVQVLYYKQSSDNNPEYLNITGCPSPCSLENFTKFVDNINPPNWNERCKIENFSITGKSLNK